MAPDAEAAAAVAEGGPDGVFESLTFGNFDVEEALIEWEGLFTGRSFEEVLDDDVPKAVVDPDDGEGPLVLAVSRKRPIPTRAGVFTAGVLAHCLPKTAWQRLSAGDGAKGHRFYDWAQGEIHSPASSTGHRSLLIRRNRRTGELAFYSWSTRAEAEAGKDSMTGAAGAAGAVSRRGRRPAGAGRGPARAWVLRGGPARAPG